MITKLTMIAAATIAAIVALTACSARPESTTIAGPAPSNSSAPASCQVNPATAPMPTAERLDPVPEPGRILVTLSGIPSGTVTPGAAPTEVDVTLCNNSAVSYPKVGVVLVLEHCSCTSSPNAMPKGTVERFDPVTGGWIPVNYPVMGTGMDYVLAWNNEQALPKGKAVTLRYRITLDASMTEGKGGVDATAVVPDGPVQIGKADLPFTVSTGPKTPSTGPTPRQTTLPFTGLYNSFAVTVDIAGNVYVVDENNRVLKLAAGSNTQTVLPFTGLNNPQHVAVDTAGNVYVADSANNRVLKLAAGSNDQTVLPFTGVRWPGDVALDAAGDVYVADSANNRVLMLAAGSNDQTVLAPTGIKNPGRIAVDTAGDVYVIDSGNKQVVKLAAGSARQTVLPFTGLNGPHGVAVDTTGNVYVLDDSGFGQVVKLAAG
jgi:streptogramin lyase